MKKKMKLLVCCVIILSLVLTLSSGAFAYALQPYYISILAPIKFTVHKDFGSTTMSHMNEACYIWNSTAGVTLMTRDPSNRHAATTFPNGNGRSQVFRTAVGTENNKYVGVEVTFLVGETNRIAESDINLNVSYPFHNGAASNKFDTWSIFQHETGHTAGLSHSGVSGATMWATCKRNDITWRTLAADDKAGIRAKY